jgi:hypothetical protein
LLLKPHAKLGDLHQEKQFSQLMITQETSSKLRKLLLLMEITKLRMWFQQQMTWRVTLKYQLWKQANTP